MVVDNTVQAAKLTGTFMIAEADMQSPEPSSLRADDIPNLGLPKRTEVN